MSDLRYSEVLGEAYYQIGLSKESQDRVDLFFSAAAHHLIRAKEARTLKNRDFHLGKYASHLCEMMEIVYKEGDFSEAVDYSGNDLNERKNWNPRLGRAPDPLMFEKMYPHPLYGEGEAHEADVYLENEVTKGFRS